VLASVIEVIGADRPASFGAASVRAPARGSGSPAPTPDRAPARRQRSGRRHLVKARQMRVGDPPSPITWSWLPDSRCRTTTCRCQRYRVMGPEFSSAAAALRCTGPTDRLLSPRQVAVTIAPLEVAGKEGLTWGDLGRRRSLGWGGAASAWGETSRRAKRWVRAATGSGPVNSLRHAPSGCLDIGRPGDK
jgi:hypothetical protein